ARALGALRSALERANVPSDQIECTRPPSSFPPRDAPTESVALKALFGERARHIPISGTKPYHAHALGASGAIEAAIACLAFERGWIPPTLNFEEGDDDCDLDYVAGNGREFRPTFCLSNSFGLGGVNACLVLGAENAVR